MPSPTKSVLKEIDKILKSGKKPSPKALSLIEGIADDLRAKKMKMKEVERKEFDNNLIGKLDDLIKATKDTKTSSDDTTKKIVEAIKKIKIEAPDVTVNQPKVEVSVPDVIVPEQPVPVVNVPEKVKMDKPSWLPKPINKQLKALTDAFKGWKLPTKAKEAIAVRLSDGEKFYKAIGGVGGALHNIVTFANSSNEKKPALVDNDGHIQVDVLTQPTMEESGIASREKQDVMIDVLNEIETNTASSGGVDPVGLKNVAEATINPATEEKQDTGNSSLSNIDSNTSDVATQTTLALMKTALDSVKAQTDKLTYNGSNYLEVNDNAGGGSSDIYAELNNHLRRFIFDGTKNLKTRIMNDSDNPVPISADTITTLTNQTKRGDLNMNFLNHLENRRTAYQSASA